MSSPADRDRRLYRALLGFFPRRHRRRYGEEMEDTFLAVLQVEKARRGWWGGARAWGMAVWDALLQGSRLRLGRGPGRGRAVPPGGHKDEGNERELGDMIVDIWGDLRFGIRALARRPFFAATVILTLAVGIGANTSVFTVVNGFLFTPLPYENPQELINIWSENPVLGWDHTDISPADQWDYRERARSLEDLAVYYSDALNMTGDGPPELVSGLRVTPNTLDLLGREPVQGRGFLPSEIGEGRDEAVILSDGFWVRRFGGDPAVLGSSITLDGKPRTVVGILAPDFRFLDQPFDLLLPQDLHPTLAPRGSHYAEAIARLADGVTLEEARAELKGLALQLQEEHPGTNENWTVEVVSTHDEMVGDIARRASMVLLVAVGFVLLMVCVNLANLLLARGSSRARELAVRSALGAGRSRVVRQLLTESLIMAALGGGLGLLLSLGGYRAIVASLPSNVPPVFQFDLNGQVLAFTAAVTCVAILLFGVVPAFRASGVGAESLRDGGRGGRSRAATRFGSSLVVLQTAIAVVLLVGGGLLMKSIAGMRSQDFGFDPKGVLTLRLAPPASDYPEEADLNVFWERVEQEVGALPSVEALGTTQSHPLMGSNWGRTFQLAGEDVDRTARLTFGSEGLFDALRFRVVAGRQLKDTDGVEAPLVAVVNETFVQRYLGDGADPLSASLSQGSDTLPTIPIVGVIHDVVERSVEAPPEPALYLPVSEGALRTRSLVVRTSGPPEDAVNMIQNAVWAVDPDIPVYQVETMESLINRRIGGFAILGYLMAIFAVLSLLLGSVGIYGVTAYAAGQRTAEIGLRLAVGAERGDVVKMVVLQGARRALVGLIMGLALAFLATGALGSVLVGVNPRDPAIFLEVTAVLVTVSLLGLWLPARRASAVDPVRALSSD